MSGPDQSSPEAVPGPGQTAPTPAPVTPELPREAAAVPSEPRGPVPPDTSPPPDGVTPPAGAPLPTEATPASAPGSETATPAADLASSLREVFQGPVVEMSFPTPAAPPAPQPGGSSAPLTPAGGTSGVSNDLEEETYAPSVPAQGAQVGEQRGDYRLTEDLGRGYFRASGPGGEAVTVYARPNPLWAALRPHRLLPRAQASGELQVIEEVGGEAPSLPLKPDQAWPLLTELARLLFALDKQGYALTDLDPASVRVAPDGPRLSLPPRVVQTGQPDPGALRDGYTPPEVLGGQGAEPRAGVYVLGALLYHWLTGQTLPPEGPSPSLLGAVAVPGVPQLLTQMLAPIPMRLRPEELLGELQDVVAPALPTYRVTARTNVGLNPDRPANEDSYGYTLRQVEAEGGSALQLRACVSDGMGGMAAGEVASRAAVKAFLDSVQPDLAAQMWEANAAVLQAMDGRDGGCTLSGVQIDGDRLQLAHVGDTRAYHLSGGELRQLSQDHSFVAALVASGQMTPEEAERSSERNKVLRSLGSLRQPQDGYVQVLEAPLKLLKGDRILLVSDGVWGEVPLPALKDVLAQPDPQAAVDRLIDLSLEAGAPDNVTALLVERVG